MAHIVYYCSSHRWSQSHFVATLAFLSKTSDVESQPIFDGRGTSNIFKLYFVACLRATKGVEQLDSGCPNSFSQNCSHLTYLHNYLSTYSFNFGVLSTILFGEKYMNNNNIFLCSKKRKPLIISNYFSPKETESMKVRLASSYMYFLNGK